jgi:transposase InsO family protein
MERELKRRRWIIHKKLQGWKEEDISRALKISTRTVRRWWKVYQLEGWRGLELKSRRPRTIHKKDKEAVQRAIELRQKYGWGPSKIAAYMKREGIGIGHGTVYRYLREAELNKPLDKPRKTWGKKRFQREHPNSLWQADFKLAEDDNWLLTYLDDHSRFVPGSEKFYDPTAENALWLLEECLDSYGKPRQILTDRGTQFYPARKRKRGETLSKFTKHCKELGIEHIVASKRRPTTIGKVEAFHKAYVFEAGMFDGLAKFVYYWNYERPHQGINYMYPAELYFNRTYVLG